MACTENPVRSLEISRPERYRQTFRSARITGLRMVDNTASPDDRDDAEENACQGREPHEFHGEQLDDEQRL